METKETQITKKEFTGFTKEEELEIFKSLANKTYKDAGIEAGLGEYFDDNKKIVSIVFAIARRIRKAPELWGLSEDALQVIQESIDNRSIKKNPALKAEASIMQDSFKDKLDEMRDNVAEIISKKLKKYNTQKGIDNVHLKDLKDLLALAIDKGRLLRGESTDNITKLAKIDADSLSPEDAMKVILRAREVLVEGKK